MIIMRTIKLPKKGEWKLLWKLNGVIILNKKYTDDRGAVTWGKNGIKKYDREKKRAILKRLKKHLPKYFPKLEVEDMIDHQNDYFIAISLKYIAITKSPYCYIKRIRGHRHFEYYKKLQKNRHKKHR